MVLLEEAKSSNDSEECRQKWEHDTLLTKYGIPVQHLDFGYVEQCKDGKELEKIVQILRSGEEGYYPELTKTAEERLAQIKPKSKLLREVGPVLHKEHLSNEEQHELEDDLTEWIGNVSSEDYKLDQYKIKKLDKNSIPEVREAKPLTYEKQAPCKKISATDYSSWDKYDVDTELLKMDLEQDNIKKEYINNNKKKTQKKTVQFKKVQTDVEALHEANLEKDKGNEYFKAGEYKEALRHYTNSINCKPTLASFTNRALVNIKLKKYRNAIDDTNSALAIEPNNIKSLVRKAQALDGLSQQDKALELIERVIEIEPNNTLAQNLAEKFRKQSRICLKNTRFAIEDISSNKKENIKRESKNGKRKSKDKNKVIIPIPGTSNMSPPYYVVCHEPNPDKVKEAIRATTPSQIIHLVSIDNSDVDDDDSCTINHLKGLCTDDIKKNCEENEAKLDESEEIGRKRNAKITNYEDKRAGGEPCFGDEVVNMPDDIHSPYSFLKTWNSSNEDRTLEQHATILRSIDMRRIVNVIGCKLDNAMFSTIIRCLCTHFAVPGEVDRLHLILRNLVNLPRFEIISMLMSQTDRTNVNVLVNFLKQHGKCLPQEVVNRYLN